MKFLATVLIFSFAINASAQEKVYFETLPVPKGTQVSEDATIPKIAWYRWTTNNFTIHSIDKDQGEYLFKNIEMMKEWCLERWGLPSIEFSAEARIFCASDVETMKKLFNLDHSAAETRMGKDGKIKISYLWLILDVSPAEIVPPSLTIIILKELEAQRNIKFSWWVYRGMPLLNSTISQIKKNCVYVGPFVDKDSKIFFSKSLLTMTEAEWMKLEPKMRQLYDSEAMLLCLMVRKEFGQGNLHQCLLTSGDKVVQDVLGFENYSSFDSTYVRYVFHLVSDIRGNKTPDTYLQIKSIKKKK